MVEELSERACHSRRSNSTASPALAVTSIAPSGSGHSTSRRGGPEIQLVRWLPGTTLKLPRPVSDTSDSQNAYFTDSRGRGSVSISRFCRPPSWCHSNRNGRLAGSGGWTSRGEGEGGTFQPRVDQNEGEGGGGA